MAKIDLPEFGETHLTGGAQQQLGPQPVPRAAPPGGSPGPPTPELARGRGKAPAPPRRTNSQTLPSRTLLPMCKRDFRFYGIITKSAGNYTDLRNSTSVHPTTTRPPFMAQVQSIKCKAAIAWDWVSPPSKRSRSCRPRPARWVRIVATGVCHTDAFTLSGEDPEGVFPASWAMKGRYRRVRRRGASLSVKVGDHVIPLYTPECGECKFCKSGQDQPVPEDPRHPGQPGADAGTAPPASPRRPAHLPPCTGTSTSANTRYCPKSPSPRWIRRPLEEVCSLGCGVTTGIGADEQPPR